MIKRTLAVVGLLGWSAIAWAQSARYTRQQDIKIEAKLSERSRPITPKDPKDQAQADQPLTADQVLAVEGLVGAIRAEQEQILIDLITKTPDSEVEEKSDYYFRLGELYAKQQRYWRLEGTRMLIQSDQTKNPQQKNLSPLFSPNQTQFEAPPAQNPDAEKEQQQPQQTANPNQKRRIRVVGPQFYPVR